MIYMINFSSVTPNVLTFQSKTIDNLKKIANIFNSYFSSIGKKAQTKINYSDKNYNDYLTTKTPPFPLTNRQRRNETDFPIPRYQETGHFLAVYCIQ